MRFLVTGNAGFIGFHLTKLLLSEGHQVFGLDNLNDYYSVALKQARLAQLLPDPKFFFELIDLADSTKINRFVKQARPECVIHLAAQAGVRYSIDNPGAYVSSNLAGFVNLLESCVHLGSVRHFIYASSSSVYGANASVPFRTSDIVDYPISLYAATKKSNELIAHAYSHLYRIPVTGLRLFTVYGPWGRPDMSYFKFTDAIVSGRNIDVYNYGKMHRDFTYIDDVLAGISSIIHHPQAQNVSDQSHGKYISNALYRIYNLGNNHPIEISEFIETLERLIGRKANKCYLPMQPGDVPCTYACMDDVAAETGFRATTPISVGLERFVDWYKHYYGGLGGRRMVS